MIKIFYAISLVALFCAANCFAQATDKKTSNVSKTIEFQQFDSYFEKNNSGLKGDKSYLAFANQKQFDKIFGAAPVMGENNFLPSDVFDTKTVAAVIKRGAFRKYKNLKVYTEKGNLVVSYEYDDAEPNSATFSSPLIVAFDKGKYKTVMFMENGKKAGTVSISK